MRSSLRFISLGMLVCAGAMLAAQQTPTPQNPKEQAWSVLNNGLTNSNTEKRTRAVHELGLLVGSQQAKDAAANCPEGSEARSPCGCRAGPGRHGSS